MMAPRIEFPWNVNLPGCCPKSALTQCPRVVAERAAAGGDACGAETGGDVAGVALGGAAWRGCAPAVAFVAETASNPRQSLR